MTHVYGVDASSNLCNSCVAQYGVGRSDMGIEFRPYILVSLAELLPIKSVFLGVIADVWCA